MQVEPPATSGTPSMWTPEPAFGAALPEGVDQAGLIACIEAGMVRPTERTVRQLERLASVATLELATDLTHGPNRIVQRIVEAVHPLLLGCRGVSVILHDPEDRTFLTSASTVPGQVSGAAATRVRSSGGATRFVVDSGRPLYVQDIDADPFGANTMLRDNGCHCYVGLPIRSDGVTIGVLYAMGVEVQQFDAEDIELLRVVADRAAVVIRAATEHVRVRRIAMHSEALSLWTARIASADDPVALFPAALQQMAMVGDYDAIVFLPGEVGEGHGLCALSHGMVSDHPRMLANEEYLAHYLERVPEGRSVRHVAVDGALPGMAVVAIREGHAMDDLDRKTLAHLATVFGLPFRGR